MLRGRHIQKSCKIRQIIYHVIKFCQALVAFPIFKNDCFHYFNMSTKKDMIINLSDNYKSSKIKKNSESETEFKEM